MSAKEEKKGESSEDDWEKEDVEEQVKKVAAKPSSKEEDAEDAELAKMTKQVKGQATKKLSTVQNIGAAFGSALDKDSQYSQKIYIDALIYAHSWFDIGGNSWDLKLIQDRISKFVSLATNQKIFLKVFIEGAQGTEENLQKYKTSQENDIHNAERFMPNNLNQIIGDAFQQEGVEVHYSIEDNDDTLAAHAVKDGAAIMSKDDVFWRYKPQPLKIYKDFILGSSGDLVFKDAREEKVTKSQVRNIKSPVPKTNMKSCSFAKVKDYHFQIVGSPSALTRYNGNPHEATKGLRASLYHHLGCKNKVNETIAFWDAKTSQTKWIDQKVTPSSHNIKLLQRKSAFEIFRMIFPKESPYRVRIRQCDQDMDWNNHLHSLISMICEIKYFFQTEKTFTELLLECSPEEVIHLEPIKKRLGYKLKCRQCRGVETFDQFQVQLIYLKRRGLPKQCTKCRMKLYGYTVKANEPCLGDIIKSSIVKTNVIIEKSEIDSYIINPQLLGKIPADFYADISDYEGEEQAAEEEEVPESQADEGDDKAVKSKTNQSLNSEKDYKNFGKQIQKILMNGDTPARVSDFYQEMSKDLGEHLDSKQIKKIHDSMMSVYNMKLQEEKQAAQKKSKKGKVVASMGGNTKGQDKFDQGIVDDNAHDDDDYGDEE